MQEIKSDRPVEAQVVLRIENRGVINGAPIYLMKRTDGFFGLAQQIGKSFDMRSPWIDVNAAAETALRVAGGDKNMITHPQALRVLAVGVLAFFASVSAPADEAQAEHEKPEEEVGHA